MDYIFVLKGAFFAMKKKIGILFVFIIMLCALSLAACGGNESQAELIYSPTTTLNGVYNTSFSASAGGATANGKTITYAVKSESTLPTGISLSKTTGQLSGTITANADTYTFTIIATCAEIEKSKEATFTLTVAKAMLSVEQPIFAGSLTYGDDLPIITTATIDGTIALDADQILTAGIKDYKWTFTPSNINYNSVTGTISLSVQKATITVAPTYI